MQFKQVYNMYILPENRTYLHSETQSSKGSVGHGMSSELQRTTCLTIHIRNQVTCIQYAKGCFS